MKRILLVADQPGWIFERHCQELQKRLIEFHIDIAFRKQNISALSKNYDLVYVLDPIPLRRGYPPQEKTIMGLRNEFLHREHPNGPKGLYEYGFPGRCASIKDKCCIFHVVNQNLMGIFKEIVTDKPLLLAQHGVDTDIFDRDSYFKSESPYLRVSTSGRGSANKGFNLVQDACLGEGFTIRAAHYGKKKLTKLEMPSFYNRADVHVCMSKTEGLNNPIMEAGAMGLPVISTRSGAAMEMIEDGVSGFLIKRNIDDLKEALEKLKDDKIRKAMGENIHDEIVANWSWDVKIEEFRDMFNLYFDNVGGK